MQAAEQFSDVDGDVLERRGRAIRMFIFNPEDAISQFPDLRADLITFFSLSTNPNLDASSQLPQNGKEAEAAQWDLAHDWALSHRD